GIRSERVPRHASRARAPAPGALSLGLLAATKNETAEREPEPERTERECADGDRLPPARKPVPAGDHRLLLHRQRLAAALLAHRTARPKPEIEVVEELGRLVGHEISVSPAPAVPADPGAAQRRARG